MSDIDSLIARIRFELDQLSARNAHHDFEHLCRHLARARICLNILPATGPVSAGGDQGRDFETYRSYLRTSLPGAGTFVGVASTRPLAFACTLQRDNVPTKIRSDVALIMGGGTRPASVHYFCERNVPVGHRHDLQAWAREQYDIELEVHDGQALSEMLAAPDVFWIASRYLRLPTDMFPKNNPQDQPSWYEDTLSQWKQESDGHIPVNYSEFVQIQRAVRYATTQATLSADLSFWITKLEVLESAAVSPNLKRRGPMKSLLLGCAVSERCSVRSHESRNICGKSMRTPARTSCKTRP